MRRRLVVFFSIWTAAAELVCGATNLRLLDDEGQPLASPVEVCLVGGLERACETVTESIFLQDWVESVQVDGEQHGPASFAARDIRRRADQTLRIPRRVELEVPRRADTVQVSVYRQDDETFRFPILRQRLGPDDVRLMVPAGRVLVSLLSSAGAPDLHLLDLQPGGHVRLSPQRRPGWSLLARVVTHSRSGEAGVAGAIGEVAPIDPATTAGSTSATRLDESRDGLLAWSGIPHDAIKLEISAIGFLPARVVGLTAAEGTFTFQEIVLQRGGWIVMATRVSGRPEQGVRCSATLSQPNYGQVATPGATIGAGDTLGDCKIGPLYEGVHRVEVEAPRVGAKAAREILVVDGAETREIVDFVPIEVRGIVTKDDVAVANAVVSAVQNRFEPFSATTNEDGEYQGVIWDPGSYRFQLDLPEGKRAPSKWVQIVGPTEQVDFDLGEMVLRGRVVNEQGDPLVSSVVISWKDGSYVLRNGVDGRFEFAVEEAGEATVRAMARKYRPSEPITVPVLEGLAPPEIVVRLERQTETRVRILSRGSPVVSAIAAMLVFDIPAILSTDAQGVVELALQEGASTTLFVSGTGCPLTSFQVSRPATEAELLDLHCPVGSSNLALNVMGTDDLPVQNASATIIQDGQLVPDWFLQAHLTRLGLSPVTDGGGRLSLVGLRPGVYDVFLNGLLTDQGHVARLALDSGSRSEYTVVTRSGDSR